MIEKCYYNGEFEYLNKDIFFQSETMLLAAISEGKTVKAKIIFVNMPIQSFYNEMEPLKNLIRYSNSANILFREAAIKGAVPFSKVERLFETLKMHIEHLSRKEKFFELWMEMIEKYCALVNNFRAKGYSPMIQRTIVWINYDITMDLTLKNIAEYLNMNPSYLSNLFHKETGVTLTAYVNERKLEHAAFLLLHSNLNISMIAQECGILDENYFARVFKKQYNISPSEYRKQKLS